MKRIEIVSKKFGTFYMFVDASRYLELSALHWAIARRRSRFYAYTLVDGKQVLAHRFIAPEYSVVDHIDDNGLNNQSSNLREGSGGVNHWNVGPRKSNKSGYKGVCWAKMQNKFKAQIKRFKRVLNLGYFDSAEDAAKAYNEAAIKYFGDAAWLNIIPETKKKAA